MDFSNGRTATAMLKADGENCQSMLSASCSGAPGFGGCGASGVATCKVGGGQVLCSSLSFKTVLKPLKTRLIKLMIYLHEGEVWGGSFPSPHFTLM